MAGVHVTTTINGDPVEFVCQPGEVLLDVLRNRLGLADGEIARLRDAGIIAESLS